MSRHQRPAYSLILLIALLPLLGAVATSAWMLAAQSMKVQGRERDAFQADASWRDLVRRLQADAGQAAAAAVNQADGSLNLEHAGRRITYRAAGERVIREAGTTSAGAQVFDWLVPQTQVRFRIESFSSGTQIVWITFTRQVRADVGPPCEKTWSVAAAVGPGRQP